MEMPETKSHITQIMERRLQSMVCDYIKDHIESNMRVNINAEFLENVRKKSSDKLDETIVYSLKMSISKGLKKKLDTCLKLLPDNLYAGDII